MRSLIGPALYILLTVGAAPVAAASKPDAEQPAPVAVQPVLVVAESVSEETMILLVGTVLIGIAAAVRRAA